MDGDENKTYFVGTPDSSTRDPVEVNFEDIVNELDIKAVNDFEVALGTQLQYLSDKIFSHPQIKTRYRDLRKEHFSVTREQFEAFGNALAEFFRVQHDVLFIDPNQNYNAEDYVYLFLHLTNKEIKLANGINLKNSKELLNRIQKNGDVRKEIGKVLNENKLELKQSHNKGLDILSFSLLMNRYVRNQLRFTTISAPLSGVVDRTVSLKLQNNVGVNDTSETIKIRPGTKKAQNKIESLGTYDEIIGSINPENKDKIIQRIYSNIGFRSEDDSKENALDIAVADQITQLLFVTETFRNKASAITALMFLELLSRADVNNTDRVKEIIRLFPMSMSGAMEASREISQRFNLKHSMDASEDAKSGENADTLLRNQGRIWIETDRQREGSLSNITSIINIINNVDNDDYPIENLINDLENIVRSTSFDSQDLGLSIRQIIENIGEYRQSIIDEKKYINQEFENILSLPPGDIPILTKKSGDDNVRALTTNIQKKYNYSEDINILSEKLEELIKTIDKFYKKGKSKQKKETNQKLKDAFLVELYILKNEIDDRASKKKTNNQNIKSELFKIVKNDKVKEYLNSQISLENVKEIIKYNLESLYNRSLSMYHVDSTNITREHSSEHFTDYDAKEDPVNQDLLSRTWYNDTNMTSLLNAILPNNSRVLTSVGSNQELELALEDILSDEGTVNPPIDYVIPLNVNVIDGSFNNPNHWVGVHIRRNDDNLKISYIDPTGRMANLDVINTFFRVMYTDSVNFTFQQLMRGRGVQFYSGISHQNTNAAHLADGSDQNNCGAFVVESLSRMVNNLDLLPASANLAASNAQGDSLRRQHLGIARDNGFDLSSDSVVSNKPNKDKKRKKGDAHQANSSDKSKSRIQSIIEKFKSIRDNGTLKDQGDYIHSLENRSISGLSTKEILEALENITKQENINPKVKNYINSRIEVIRSTIRSDNILEDLDDTNLTLSEQSNLSSKLQKNTNGAIDAEYNFLDRLNELNIDNKKLIDSIYKKSVIESNLGIKSIDVKNRMGEEATKMGKVDYITENDHKRDHGLVVASLQKAISSGQIGTDTVITIERLQYGENLGMRDVIALSYIMEHNTKSDDKIKIPDEISKSLMEADSELYLEARKKGIKMIGIEGNNLKENKGSEIYDVNREKYMSHMVDAIVRRGYDVILDIGEAHRESIEKDLKILKAKKEVRGQEFGASILKTANSSVTSSKEKTRLRVSDFKPPSFPGAVSSSSWVERLSASRARNKGKGFGGRGS